MRKIFFELEEVLIYKATHGTLQLHITIVRAIFEALDTSLKCALGKAKYIDYPMWMCKYLKAVLNKELLRHSLSSSHFLKPLNRYSEIYYSTH